MNWRASVRTSTKMQGKRRLNKWARLLEEAVRHQPQAIVPTAAAMRDWQLRARMIGKWAG